MGRKEGRRGEGEGGNVKTRGNWNRDEEGEGEMRKKWWRERKEERK